MFPKSEIEIQNNLNNSVLLILDDLRDHKSLISSENLKRKIFNLQLVYLKGVLSEKVIFRLNYYITPKHKNSVVWEVNLIDVIERLQNDLPGDLPLEDMLRIQQDLADIAGIRRDDLMRMDAIEN